MDLKGLYLKNITVNTNMPIINNTASKSSSSGANFGDYLSKANNYASNNSVSERKDNPALKKDNIKDNLNRNKIKDVSEVKSDNDRTNSTDTDKKDIVKDNTAVSDKTEDKTIKDKNEEAINKLAEALNLPVEQVQNILQQLNLQPQDLMDMNNLLNFMMKAFNVDNATDLLSINNIKDIMNQVKDIISDLTSFDENILQKLDISNEMQENTVQTNSENTSGNTGNLKNADIANTNLKNTGNLNQTDQTKNVNNDETKVQNNVNAENQAKVSAVSGETSNQQTGLNNNQSGQTNLTEQINPIANTVQENIQKVFGEVISRVNKYKDVNTDDIIKQIVEKLTISNSEKISQIKLTLKPEYLGDVSLKISSQNGVITAQFTAENQKIKEIIESNFNQLKEVLNSQGIQVSELSVNIGNENSNNEMYKSMQENEKSSKRINSIINKLHNEEIETDDINTNMNYLDEGQVLETNINYRA